MIFDVSGINSIRSFWTLSESGRIRASAADVLQHGLRQREMLISTWKKSAPRDRRTSGVGSGEACSAHWARKARRGSSILRASGLSDPATFPY
jgi:hypothetical protein